MLILIELTSQVKYEEHIYLLRMYLNLHSITIQKLKMY